MAETTHPPKIAAISMLAGGMSYSATGAAIDTPAETVRNWMRDPAFRADVKAVRRAVLDESVGALTTAVREAVDTLRAALQDGSPMVRVRAAAELLRALPALASHTELESRITELESRMSNKEDSHGIP